MTGTDGLVNRRTIIAALLCIAFGPSMFLLMPIYVGVLQSALQFSESELGLLASADLIGLALASLLAPLWINRAPWRLLSAICFSGLIACNVSAMFVHEFNALFMLRLLAGVQIGCVAAVIMGIFSHARFPDKVAALMVIVQVAYQSIAFLILPRYVSATGLEGFLLSVIAVQLVALASIFYFPRRPIIAEQTRSTAGAGGGLSHLPALFILAAMAAFFVGQASLWAFIELIGNNSGLDNTEVGYALAVSTFIALVGPIWGAWAGDRFGRLKPVLLGGIAQIVVLFFMDAATSVWAYAAALSVFQLFWNLGIGYQYGALVDADHSNRFVVIVPAAQCAGIAAGPIIAGVALQGMGNTGVYLVSGAALVLYLVLIVPFLIHRK